MAPSTDIPCQSSRTAVPMLFPPGIGFVLSVITLLLLSPKGDPNQQEQQGGNMWNWLSRTIGALTTSATASPTTTPTGEKLVALAIKSEVTNYPFDSSRPALHLVKGTVAACLNARSQERGVLRFIVKQNGTDTTISKQLQKVLNRPNPVQSRFDFMEMASQFHDACGQAVLYFINGDLGVAAEVWCLPSFYIIPIFNDPSDPIPSGYRWADGRVIAESECVCLIRNNSLKTAPYTGRGALNDQFDNALLYDLVVQSQKNWFRTGGAPNVALAAPLGTSLTITQIEDLQSLWNKRYNPATGTSNIAALPDGMTAINFGTQEMNYNNSKDEIRDSIREAFQLPKIILGDTDNVNHNNGQTALAMFERIVILRWGQKFANGVEAHFQKNYSPNITVEVDPEVIKGFTQLPAMNGVITTPSEYQFVPEAAGDARA